MLVALGCVEPPASPALDAAPLPDAGKRDARPPRPDAPEEEPDAAVPEDGPPDAPPPDAAAPPDALPPPDAPPDACVPTTCAAEMANCGTIPDNCSGTLMCGTCMAPESCGGGGVMNRCGVDRSWALWRMPDSRTEFCTDGDQLAVSCDMTPATVAGQDGHTRINVPNYTPNGDTILDSVTGLTWQRPIGRDAGGGDLFTHAEASAYCSTLNLGGMTGWRLPSRIELVSIVDYGRSMPAIDTAFTDTPGLDLWTSSTFNNDPDTGWVVNFEFGLTGASPRMTGNRVRCVR